mgnify:CR=1
NASTGSGTIAVAQVGQDGGTAGTEGTFSIGNGTTTGITLDGTKYSFDGNVLITAASGNTIDLNQTTGAVTFTTAADSI